jgi:hypothetical protein
MECKATQEVGMGDLTCALDAAHDDLGSPHWDRARGVVWESGVDRAEMVVRFGEQVMAG